MTAPLPLKGLKVVAVEQAVAAPFCTARLADAGAEVIKIERPGGDFARGYDNVAAGLSSYFVWLNRGKKSRVLDLADPPDKTEFHTLLKNADVLVQNLKRGALARLGFGADRLRHEFPRLITCSISGYGETGAMADRKAYDLLVQAESGLSSVTGGPSEPARVGISVVDIATGATAHAAVLEALIQRGLTGQGTAITLSMFDVIADWLTVPLLNHEGGETPKRMGLSHPSISPYGAFETKDGRKILISIQSDREWKKFARLFLEDTALGHDSCFVTNVARVSNRSKTDALVAAAFARRTADEAIAVLQASDVALAEVNNMAGLSMHPHLRRITVETSNGPVSYPAPGPLFDGEERIFGPVPTLRECD